MTLLGGAGTVKGQARKRILFFYFHYLCTMPRRYVKDASPTMASNGLQNEATGPVGPWSLTI